MIGDFCMDNTQNTPENVQDAAQPQADTASQNVTSNSVPEVQEQKMPETFSEEVGSQPSTENKEFTQEQRNSYQAGRRHAQKEFEEKIPSLVDEAVQNAMANVDNPAISPTLKKDIEQMKYQNMRQTQIDSYIAKNPNDAALKADVMMMAGEEKYKQIPTHELVAFAKMKQAQQQVPNPPVAQQPDTQNVSMNTAQTVASAPTDAFDELNQQLRAQGKAEVDRHQIMQNLRNNAPLNIDGGV